MNTFTEHRGSHWSSKDMQHTYVPVNSDENVCLSSSFSTMGVLCAFGSEMIIRHLTYYRRVGWRSTRNFPLEEEPTKCGSIIDVRFNFYHTSQCFWFNVDRSIILTGWAMSEHAQALMLSTKVRFNEF